MFSHVLYTGQLGVVASNAVHVGDDPKADKQGAIAVGLESW